MNALILALLAVLLVYHSTHRKPPQRTPVSAKAWADWFSGHPNGGGV